MIRLLLLLVLACKPIPGDTTRCQGIESESETEECCADAGDEDCAGGLLPVDMDVPMSECQHDYCEAYYDAGCPRIGEPVAKC